jgi:gamma-glutamylcyclotransferase (GGCT)/AIG2-like uncharacterized protein YtfP
MEKVFIYGTLRDEMLRKEITGREIFVTSTGELVGFEMSSVFEDGHSYPIIIRNENSNQIINGDVIEVNDEELLLLDRYEGEFYRRMKIRLENGIRAWSYIK